VVAIADAWSVAPLLGAVHFVGGRAVSDALGGLSARHASARIRCVRRGGDGARVQCNARRLDSD
jgi:hypothetical protein